VGFSAFVALTMTPMMSSKLFANGMPKSRMAGGVDRMFHNPGRALCRRAPPRDRRQKRPVDRRGFAGFVWRADLVFVSGFRSRAALAE
jgi:hypothetical protein